MAKQWESLNRDGLAPEKDPPVGVDEISRRRFLALVSASAALALSASCSRADRQSIVPYTSSHGALTPGIPAFFVSTFQEGMEVSGLCVHTREGRPIHIEANTDHAANRGGAGLRALGDLLGLYDPDRLKAPSFRGAPRSWEEALRALGDMLADARLMRKPVLLLTGVAVSPALKDLLYDLAFSIPGLRHAAWEPCGGQSEALSLKALYGRPLTTRLCVDKARVLVALQSDFLGADPGAAGHIRSFASRRAIARPDEGMNRLWAIEGAVTLTGSNADERLMLRPSHAARLAFTLMHLLASAHALALPSGLTLEALSDFAVDRAASALGMSAAVLKRLAADLARAGADSLVVAGAALPPEAHAACLLLNHMLGAVGNTLVIEPSPASPEPVALDELGEILRECAAGRYAAGIFWGVNPAYAFPDHALWKRALARIPATFRIGLWEDETALDCVWRLPEHHWLESWGDYEFSRDFIGLRQPAIRPLYDTLQGEDILMACLRRLQVETKRDYATHLKARWRLEEYPADSPASFEAFWNAALREGGFKRNAARFVLPDMKTGGMESALAAARRCGAVRGMEIVLSPGAGVYDGRYANNGWLQELPDPVTKATWGNPVSLSSVDAARLHVRNGDILQLSYDEAALEAPVLIQPGQAPGVASISLGYGRRTGSVAVGIGSNAYALMPLRSDSPRLIPGIGLHRSGRSLGPNLNRSQQHPRMEVRQPAQSWTLATFAARVKGPLKVPEVRAAPSLIPERRYSKHKWGMVVDLSACVGCSACVIACQIENNIPVVGPEQVARGRDMHWMRVDRYYEGDPNSPRTLHQPMFCQHCENAPCEIVCPVNATTHSPDGLNQMTYSRCVGARHCSNNCPFKVRRFNFFDYTSGIKESELLARNPEVTVRPRGVMEKCTFCVQRIQEARQKAKVEGRPVADGDILPACAAACSAGAIVFGDLNDMGSRASRLASGVRGYRLLEDLGIGSRVTYLADLANPADRKEGR